MQGITVLLILGFASVAFTYDDQCPPEQEHDWSIEKLLRHEDCNKFYKCTFGVPIEYKCYGDLYFNLETWQCDWPHNVDCGDRNTTPAPSPTSPSTESTTTTTPTTTTTTTPSTTTSTTTTTTTTTPAPTTTTTTTTTTTPAPTTSTASSTTSDPCNCCCTTTTTSTTTSTTTTTPAPTTSTASTTSDPCNCCCTTTTQTPSTTTTSAPTTSSTTTTTSAPSTSSTITTTTSAPTTSSTTTQATTARPEFLPNGCPVNPHIHWLLPHETDCTLFYYCVWGELVLRECPFSGLGPGARLHFNRVLQVCDWPNNAGCVTSFNKHLFGRLEFTAR